MGQSFDVYVGSTPRRAKLEYWNGDIAWVSSSEVAFSRIKCTREYITEEGLRNSSLYVHPEGTVLLGMIGEGKTRGQVSILDIPACNSQNSAAIRVSESGFPPEYVFYYLWSQYEATRQVGSGNNQPALNKSRVQEIEFPLPPLAEQCRIVAEVDHASPSYSKPKPQLRPTSHEPSAGARASSSAPLRASSSPKTPTTSQRPSCLNASRLNVEAARAEAQHKRKTRSRRAERAKA